MSKTVCYRIYVAADVYVTSLEFSYLSLLILINGSNGRKFTPLKKFLKLVLESSITGNWLG